MTQQTIPAARTVAPGAACDRATRVTKTLLGYGVIAGRQRRQQRDLHRSGRARLDLDLGARGSPLPPRRTSARRLTDAGPAPTGLVRRVDATASRSRRNDQGQPDPAEDSQKEISRCVTWCC
jgi:hypothetical protein